MKAAHIVKVERRLEVARVTLLPERTVRGEVAAPDTRLRRLLARLDTARYRGTFNRSVLARLRALAIDHESHGDPASPDWRDPEIGWIRQPGGTV